MSRNCKVYIPNDGPCGTNGSGLSSDFVDSNICYDRAGMTMTKTGPIAKLISDPTGNGRGYGINNKSDCKEFCYSLTTQITVDVLCGGSVRNKTLRVNKNLAKEIWQIFNEIRKSNADLAKNFNFNFESLYCYSYRHAQGVGANTSSLSMHSYGVAIDINPGDNPYLQTPDGKSDSRTHLRTDSHPVVQIFKKYNWAWGGDWSKPDYMHFEKAGINR